MRDDAVIYFGGDIKAQGEGRFGGYVLRWGSPKDTDPEGEFFHPGCDFWGKTTGDLAYHHGLGRKGDRLAERFGKRRIAEISLKANPIGLWGEGALNLGDADEAELYQRIIDGEMGFSSGSADRFVQRTPVGGKVRIDSWPLFEISVTPRPVEPRNRVVAMKALADEAEAGGVVTASLVDRTEALVTDAEELAALYGKAAAQRRREGRNLPESKRDAIKALHGALGSLYAATATGPDPERVAALRRRALVLRMRRDHANR